ncbi:substrate-binding domain-containing protein [Streptomyces sp. CB01881]|uniref:sugar ABC transporter substrate-binding protein n=1 Tax=Streptomyces sp. CB01881 TaxID=2078691 RepID=UPI000CDCBFDC|nr:substrate-binding domain-containing protein [Streptomyces sp. CB01881]AUY53386.1 ABC transporter substrate-binding protein [Streptomyces sp. CB01881]TYC69537.1 sugar ABC transporter substrate-binding protein [Streptomyces sp. CB01881]
MNAMTRRLVIGTAAVSMALSMAACGKAGGDKKDSASSGDTKSIGLLLPENASSTRYESFDRPFIEAKVKSLCPDCKVQYSNAEGSAAKQKQQFDTLIAQGVKVIVLDAFDAKSTQSWVKEAADKGVKVIAYDRLATGPVSAYVSFDNEKVGELQGQALLDALGAKAADANIVMINGDEADPNAAKFKSGAHKALDGKVKKVVYEQSGEWKPTVAGQKIGAAITQFGKDGFQAVYSANDGMAGAIVTQLKSAGISVPVGGQDAGLDAVQRIVSGDQAYTIYKAYKPLAESAAELAVNLLQGKDIKGVASATVDSDTDKGIPAKLLEPKVVTKANINDTVIADGLYKAADICTADFAAACTAAGIK